MVWFGLVCVSEPTLRVEQNINSKLFRLVSIFSSQGSLRLAGVSFYHPTEILFLYPRAECLTLKKNLAFATSRTDRTGFKWSLSCEEVIEETETSFSKRKKWNLFKKKCWLSKSYQIKLDSWAHVNVFDSLNCITADWHTKRKWTLFLLSEASDSRMLAIKETKTSSSKATPPECV